MTLLAFFTLLLSSCAPTLAQSSVHTVLIEPSFQLIAWPGTEINVTDSNIRSSIPTNSGSDGGITVTADSSIQERDLVTFYNDVYSTSDDLIVFLDLRLDSCPIDLFRNRLLGYITMTTTACPRTSDVTAGATIHVDTRSFNLMGFMARFLTSWSTATASGRFHTSFALLFDKSGEDHFLQPQRHISSRLIFEITLPLTNCSHSSHVTDLAAKTNTKDVIVMATTSCIRDLLMAVSELHLPPTRFRWLLYPTDHADESLSLADVNKFIDNVEPVMIVEKGKPVARPIYSQDKLVHFATQGIERFLSASGGTNNGDVCLLNCTSNCSACQVLYQEKLQELNGQMYEVFLTDSDNERADIVFDLHRLSSTGHIFLGNWSQNTGLHLNQQAYTDRFINTQLSVVVIVEPPFVFRNESIPGEVSYYGYSMDVLKEISIRVGFTYTVRECDSGGYGLLDGGKWTGCIGNIVRGEADVILGALTVTAERDQVVDFTLPYYNFAGIQILMRKQAANIDLFYYANVFTTPAWLALGAVVVLTSLLLWAFEKVTSSETRKGHYSINRPVTRTSSVPLPTINVNGVSSSTSNNNITNGSSDTRHIPARSLANGTSHSINNVTSKNNSSFRRADGNDSGKSTSKTTEAKKTEKPSPAPQDTIYTLGESIWFVIGALTMAGGGDPPRSLSGRLLIAGFWFFAVIMMSTFTANLAAFLTVSRMGMTISSLDDLAAQTDVKYSVVDQSSVMEYFQRMAKIEDDFYERWKTISLDNDNEAQDSLAVWDYPLGNKYGGMWKTIQNTGLIKSNEIGLEKVKSENFALITESPLIQYYTDRNCDLTAVGDQFSIRPYSIGLKERSPYTSKFSDAILELQKERELGSLRLRWWTNQESSCPKETGNAGLDLFSLSGTFIVAGAGVASGLIVLVLEHIFSQLRKTRRTRRAQSSNNDVVAAKSG